MYGAFFMIQKKINKKIDIYNLYSLIIFLINIPLMDSNTIDPEDYRCPCCMNYIYANYMCEKKHNMCGHCYMKLSKCPICRNEKINEGKLHPQNDVPKKECKNKHKGCELDLYCFDDDHEEDCLYNPLHCKFCKFDINDVTFDSIKNHFGSNCINSFNVMTYTHTDTKEETEGRKIKVNYIKPEPCLLNIHNEYFVMVIPKTSYNKVNFVVFSINERYKLSNYKIKILSQSGTTLCESNIYNKKMYEASVQFSDIKTTGNTLSFTIENMFMLNRKTSTWKSGNTTFVHSYNVDGEPGSAGNWTHAEFVEMQKNMSHLFREYI